MKRLVIQCLCLLLIALPAAAQTAFPDDDAVMQILRKLIDEQKRGDVIVVGLIDASGRRVIAHHRDAARTADGDTLFEIGSISKVFTAILLADMAHKGEVKLDDPVQKYLPAGVTVPSRNGKLITLQNLSQQDSGLPRMPMNLSPADYRNPYANYTVEQLYAFLNKATLSRDPGAKYEYSNLGVGLLGHVLALRAGVSYEELLRARILTPLGMTDTVIDLPPSLQARFIDGFDESLLPASHWDIPTLAGAGAIRSTVNDMLKFLAENLGFTDNGLHAVMTGTHAPRVSMGQEGLQMGLNWVVQTGHGTTIVWHNGGTGGFRSFCGFDAAAKRGVVVLTNTANSPDDIGLHLLNAAYPIAELTPPRQRIALEPAAFDIYVGTYELNPAMVLDVRRDGENFLVQLTGQQAFSIYPEAPDRFFLTVVDAQISFVRDESGAVSSLVLHQNGANMPARKVK